MIEPHPGSGDRSPPPPPPPAPGRFRRSRLIAFACVVAALIGPVLWAVIAHPGASVGDIALIELRTRDVISAHPPLVGAYSRYGWAHPGPMFFYLFSVPYRAFGRDADALRLSALLLNSATLATMAWVARRRGAAPFFLLTASICALAWGLPPMALTDSWNVTIALLPFMLTIVACWCALCDDRWAWLVAAVAFSFVFQTHVGFGVVLAPLFLVTAVALTIRARRADATGIRGADIGIGLAAGFAVALPALYDAVAHWPGNLSELAEWSITNGEPTVGLIDGLRVVGRTSSLSFPLQAEFPNQFVVSIGAISTGFAPGTLLVLLTAALVVAIRRGWRSERLLCGCLALVWLSGTVAAARVTRPLEFWLIQWLQPLAWLTWAAVALVAWRLLQPAVDRRRLPGAVMAVVASIVLIIGTVAYIGGAACRPDVRLFLRNEPTALPPLDDATTLSISDPLSPSQRAEADDLTAQLTEILQRNDLDASVPLLYTSLADLVVGDSPPPEVDARRADVLRLAELRRVPGTRFGLYAISGSEPTG